MKHHSSKTDLSKHSISTLEKELDQYLARINHELRTPLNAISGAAYLLLQTNPTSRQMEYVDAIRISSENMLSIINDLLDYARIKSGKIEFERNPFDVRALIEHVIQIERVQAKRKGISLAYSVDDSVPAVLVGDHVRLQQMLINLLTNAVKFTDEGGVQLALKAELLNSKMTVLVFTVVDTGIGINEESLPKIFDDYVRSSSPGSKRRLGTGLGLPITKQLAEQQGGTIEVQSKINTGTTFTVRLPFLAADKKIVNHPVYISSSPNAALQGIRILAVEDNEFNQLIVRELFHLWQVKYKIVENGKKALSIISKNDFDLILLDIGLPDISGYEVMRKIRFQFPKGKRKIPVIALTAATSSSERKMALEAGFDDYLAKPFSSDVLYRKICSLLKIAGNISDVKNVDKISFPETEYFKPNDILKQNTMNPDFLIELIETFIAQAPAQIVELSAAVQQRKYETAARIAHKTKSMFAYLKLGKSVKRIRQIEAQTLEAVSADRILQSIEKLESETAQSIYEMNVVLAKLKML